VIRIFVGCSGSNEDLESQAVLAHSLGEHCPDPLDITWLMLSRDPESYWFSDPQNKLGWRTDGWTNPYVALRWAIPEFCKFEGRAIYLDCHMISVSDISELWRQPFPPGQPILAKSGPEIVSDTMLIDCEAINPFLPRVIEQREVPGKYKEIRNTVEPLVADFDGDWNCRDNRDFGKYPLPFLSDPRIKMLHYVTVETQPQHRYARERRSSRGLPYWFSGPDLPHPYPEMTELFDRTLVEATAAGVGPETFRVDPEFGNYGIKGR